MDSIDQPMYYDVAGLTLKYAQGDSFETFESANSRRRPEFKRKGKLTKLVFFEHVKALYLTYLEDVPLTER